MEYKNIENDMSMLYDLVHWDLDDIPNACSQDSAVIHVFTVTFCFPANGTGCSIFIICIMSMCKQGVVSIPIPTVRMFLLQNCRQDSDVLVIISVRRMYFLLVHKPSGALLSKLNVKLKSIFLSILSKHKFKGIKWECHRASPLLFEILFSVVYMKYQKTISECLAKHLLCC